MSPKHLLHQGTRRYYCNATLSLTTLLEWYVSPHAHGFQAQDPTEVTLLVERAYPHTSHKPQNQPTISVKDVPGLIVLGSPWRVNFAWTESRRSSLVGCHGPQQELLAMVFGFVPRRG